MPTCTIDDLARMREGLYFDEPGQSAKLSKFWALLLLAAVIASAGVVSDSTATVIGAMIVAPLMVPILGTVLAIVTGDRANLARSVLMVLGGALAAIAIGYLFGLVAPVPVVAETSSQVAGRVSPRLIDLVAALATGAVGAFANCRRDISDALPGVAIAISLVPPLSVVGLTLEAGAYDQSAGALLLFGTNVAAILLSGCVVMAMFRVHRLALDETGTSMHRRNAVLVVVALVVVVAVPLGVSTVTTASQNLERIDVANVAKGWAAPQGWRIVSVEPREKGMVVKAAGPLPAPDTGTLRVALNESGLEHVDVVVLLEPEQLVALPGS